MPPTSTCCPPATSQTTPPIKRATTFTALRASRSNTDEVHRCNALQSSSVHHRINQWEWSRPSGLPPPRITHEPQHDWSLLTIPKPVPYSQSHIFSLSLRRWTEMHVISVGDKLTHTVGALPLMFSPEFSHSYFSENSWSLTSNLERLDRCSPMTWLSGFSKDLPTYEEKCSTIGEKEGESCRNSWKTIKHSGQFSNQTLIIIL